MARERLHLLQPSRRCQERSRLLLPGPPAVRSPLASGRVSPWKAAQWKAEKSLMEGGREEMLTAELARALPQRGLLRTRGSSAYKPLRERGGERQSSVAVCISGGL